MITFVDDIDQEELAPDEVRTVKFGYRGADYVLDLSELNAAILDEELEPYLGAARKLPKSVSAGTGRSSSASSSASSASTSASNAARNRRIRQWANDNGREVSARGKIAADVISDYEAAHPEDK